MKADTLFPPAPASSDEVDLRPIRRASSGSERQDFGRALDRATPVDDRLETELEGEQATADRDRQRDGKREDQAPAVAAAAPSPAPVPAALPSAAWLYQPSPAAARSPEPAADDDAPAGVGDRRPARPSQRERATSPAGPRAAEPPTQARPELFEPGSPVAAPASGEPAPLPPERPVPDPHPLERAAAEANAHVGVLARAAHILVGPEGSRGLELHLRVMGDRSELRAAGPLAPLIRARLSELELVLAAQGLPLTTFELTERSGSAADPDPEPSGPDTGRDGVKKVRGIKA
jgi:hypothetical protein